MGRPRGRHACSVVSRGSPGARRGLAFFAFVPLVVALACGGSERAPDVVLITLDTTRADALGAYGAPGDPTPHLDALATGGTLFERASAQASVTPVSHASIFTGQNPYTHGLRLMHGRTRNRLAEEAVTLAELLRDAGYRTAAFVSAFPATARFGLAQGFEHFDAAFLDDEEPISANGAVNTGTSQRRADVTTDRALAWLVEESARPRFVWVHYFDPHDALVLPPESFVRQHVAPPADDATGAEAARARLRALYAVEVRYMDEQVGRLLDAFDPEHTAVAVVADHGEGHGDHGWWTHGLLYEEQVRVPLIVRAPGGVAGRRVETRVRTIDVAPTLLELAGVAREGWPAMEGRSLVAALRGEPIGGATAYADSLSLMTYHATQEIVDRKQDMLFAVTDGGWKYIYHALRPAESELYDLRNDPGETRNLVREAPDELARMRALFESADLIPDELPVLERMDPDDAARLRSLGYAR